MNAVWARFWKVGRSEILIGLVLAVAVADVAVTLALNAARPPVDCILRGDIDSPGCQARSFYDLRESAGQLLALNGILPVAIGAVFGCQLVAREIEHQTAPMVWVLAPSRVRWLLENVALVGLVTVLVMIPPAVGSTLLQGAMEPGYDSWSSLMNFALRGPSLIGLGLAVLSFGVLCGAVTGRVLPALLLATALGLAAFTVAPVLATVGQPDAVIARLGDHQISHGIFRYAGYIDSQGTVLTFDQAVRLAPAGVEADVWIQKNLQPVGVGIPGSRYPLVELELLGELAGATVLALTGAVVVVQRRRPY